MVVVGAGVVVVGTGVVVVGAGVVVVGASVVVVGAGVVVVGAGVVVVGASVVVVGARVVVVGTGVVVVGAGVVVVGAIVVVVVTRGSKNSMFVVELNGQSSLAMSIPLLQSMTCSWGDALPVPDAITLPPPILSRRRRPGHELLPVPVTRIFVGL